MCAMELIACDVGTKKTAPWLKMLHPGTVLPFALTQGSGIPDKPWSQGSVITVSLRGRFSPALECPVFLR